MPPPKIVPEWFYCIQSGSIMSCETQCNEYCENASGTIIEPCKIVGNNGCELQGKGCDERFYKCACTVECP